MQEKLLNGMRVFLVCRRFTHLLCKFRKQLIWSYINLNIWLLSYYYYYYYYYYHYYYY